jgi:hypothetical protein
MSGQTRKKQLAGMKVLSAAALATALVGGLLVINFPLYDRIDIGRPLGKMYIKVSNDIILDDKGSDTYRLVQFERRGTGTYALIHGEYSGEGRERKLKRTLQVGVKYLPQLPKGWEDFPLEDRPSLVADALLSAKRPDRSSQTCWVGKLHDSHRDWIAISYQQTFYTRDGSATDNYRGIFLVFRPPTGGLILLDLFKKRESTENVDDWKQVRKYLGNVNRMLYFEDDNRPHMAAGDNEFNPLPIPTQNPLCLGPYRLTIPKGSQLITEAGGYYRLNDSRQGVEARLSYREKLVPDIIDPVKKLRPDCKAELQPLTKQPRNPDESLRYVRATNGRGTCTPYYQGLLKSWSLPFGSAITLDVFVRSPKADAKPLPSSWPEIDEYLRDIEQQTLSRCYRPGKGNLDEEGKPVLVPLASNRHASAPVRIDADSPGRCIA